MLGAACSILGGEEGTPAPEPAGALPSACQPRAVMPHLFALIDRRDASLSGLRQVLMDVAAPICLDRGTRACASDEQCAIGHCQDGLCPCQSSYSPLGDVIGISLRAMASIAGDAAESPTGCVSAAHAKELPPPARNRLCELRRALDVLLLQNGGMRVLGDPDVRRVIFALFDYLQGKTDGTPHYELFSALGRMAAAQSASCDPAALFNLADAALGYLTPQIGLAQLGAVQALLADPQTQKLLAQLAQSAGKGGREGAIVLAHSLLPGLISAPDAQTALRPLENLLSQFVYASASYSQQFKDELRAAMAQTESMLAPSTGIFPPLQKALACAASAPVRCADAASCSNSDDELIGALYDILSRPQAQGGVDLAILAGALKALAALDQTGQMARTLRMIARGIAGSPDPNDAHETRAAVCELAGEALNAEEMQKLVPALRALVDKGVVTELFALLQDILYRCNPPR